MGGARGLRAGAADARARSRGGGGSRFGSSRNLTPLLRLIGLIALAILIVVLLVVWVEGCTADAKRERNSTYLAEIGAIGNASARLGQQLSTLLTTPGLNQEDLDAKLGGYVQTADNQVQRAEDLNPPGPMVGPNAGAVEALRYRANGLRGLQVAFKETVDETDASVAGGALARADAALARERHHLDRLVPAAGGGRARGRGDRGSRRPVVRVRHGGRPHQPELARGDLAADPGRVDRRDADGPARQPDRVRQGASRAASSSPRRPRRRSRSPTSSPFEIGVTDSGESQEVRIKVTLTIPKQPDPIVKTAVIPIIDPGETKSVTLSVGALVPFGEQTTVKVDVDPVPGETNTSNNTAEYPVIFTL